MSRMGAFVITGAGSGIGRAIAVRILSEGHHVFGLGRDPKKLEAVARETGEGRFSFSSVDISRAEDSARTTQEIRRWLKSKNLPLLGLVNNAGIFDRTPFTQTSDAVWERHFETNLLAPVRLAREFHAELKAAHPSSVLNISSTLGLRPVAQTAAYSAIKAAMVNWTKCLAIEWASDGIRANCICPGLVDTPIHSFHSLPETDENRTRAHSAQPLGRMGHADDIAETAWFLLSEQSSWTTGSIVTVDGGISL